MRLFIPAFISLMLTCASARKPNVIIFFTDDQGTLDAGCYGSGDLITPNIDKLASEFPDLRFADEKVLAQGTADRRRRRMRASLGLR